MVSFGAFSMVSTALPSNRCTSVTHERISLPSTSTLADIACFVPELRKFKDALQLHLQFSGTSTSARIHMIIAMTHMLPIPEFCVPTEREMWKYFNAFLGTGALGQLFERYQVSYSICGHVHYRKQAVHGQTRYLCACLGYHTEWPVYAAAAPGGSTELDWQIKNTVQWIDW